MNSGKFPLRQILRFLVGGGSAVVVDFVSYLLLYRLGLSINLAKAISYILGAAVGFVINKIWTFESRKFHMSEIVRYIILYAFSALVNTGINRLVLNLGVPLLAFLSATAVSTVINFLGQKFFVFQHSKDVT